MLRIFKDCLIGRADQDGEERRMFGDMLRSMVVYDPEKRITVEEVVARLSRVIND